MPRGSYLGGDPATGGWVSVAYRGRWMMHLETDFGMVVEFDGDWLITVELPIQAANSVDGLCRNFDGVRANDRILPGGTVLPPIHPLGKLFKVVDPEDPS